MEIVRKVNKDRFFEILGTVNQNLIDLGNEEQFNIQVDYAYCMFCKTYNFKDNSLSDRTKVSVKLGTVIYVISDIKTPEEFLMFIESMNEYVGNIQVRFIDWGII